MFLKAIALFRGEIVSYYMRFFGLTDSKGLARLLDARCVMQTAKSLFHIAADACTRINGPETKDLAALLNFFGINHLQMACLYLIESKRAKCGIS